MSKLSAKDEQVTEVKILCRFCDIRDTCRRRANKEKYEESGWITRCTITPNRPKKKKLK